VHPKRHGESRVCAPRMLPLRAKLRILSGEASVKNRQGLPAGFTKRNSGASLKVSSAPVGERVRLQNKESTGLAFPPQRSRRRRLRLWCLGGTCLM
jgi:hypothetical protein